MAYKCLIVIMLGIITFGLTLGCEESPESAARKQANDSIEKTSQILQAGQSSSGGAGGMPTDQAAFNSTLNDWDQMVNGIAPNDADALKTAAYEITRISQGLIEQEQAATQADATRQVQQILSQASSSARQNARGAQTAPDLMLASIHLSIARDNVNRLAQHSAQIHTDQAVISDLLMSFFKEDSISKTVENRRPTDHVNLLKNRLEKPNSGLDQELRTTDATVKQLFDDRVALQQEYKIARDAAVAKQRQYNELLIQADNAEGAERFQLQQEAYILQIGSEQDGNKVIGSIELESQAQKLETQLTSLDLKLQYQLLWQSNLKEEISSINDTIDQLQSVELSQSITDDFDKSIKNKENLIALISKKLNELQAAEEQYATLRQDAVDAFESARSTFDSVSGSSDRNFAQDLRLIATKELAQLWSNDASHNQLGETILITAVKVPELNSLASQIKQACEQAQANALQLARDLEAEIAAAEADAPAMGGYPDNTMAGGSYPGIDPTGGYPDENIPAQPPVVTPPQTFGDPNNIR